jgi:hypothetical protein
MTGATVDELREQLQNITVVRQQHERQRREHEQHIARLAAEEERVRAQLDAYAADEMALRSISSAQIRVRRTRSATIPLQRTLDAVAALGRFSVSELAAELECGPAQARRELKRPEVARVVEPIEGRERYGYVGPAAPITDREIEELAAEAEAGYDIDIDVDEAPRTRRGEVVVLRLQTGHAAIKGEIGKDVAVAYTTQSPREEVAS